MNKKSKILFICPYPEGKAPSQRLKFEQYYSIFEKEGYELTKDSFFNEQAWFKLYKKGFFLSKLYATVLGYLKRSALLFRIKNYDIIYVHLWGTPFGASFYERLIRLRSKKLIYDIDDMVFLGHSSDANKFWQSLKGKRKMIYLMKAADHVITCTPKLDEFVRQFNQNTTDISSTVDTERRYLPLNNYKNDHQLVIGWSGSHSTSKYLYLLQEVLQKLAKKYDFKLLILGDASFNIAGVNTEAIEWSEEVEMSILKQFDIGLYPLPDEEWVYGKSGLKAIQYMALGIPTVATAIGANFRVIDHKESGFLVPPNDYKRWYSILSDLIVNETLRRDVGTKARKKIEETYSVEANKKYYLEILGKL